MTVKNLVLNGTVTRQSPTYSTLTVTGSITGGGTTPTLIMAEGAAFKPNGKGFLRITESLAPANGTMTVDIGEIDFSAGKAIPLFRVGSAGMLPNTVELVNGTLPEGWALTRTSDGLGYRIRNRNRQLRLILR